MNSLIEAKSLYKTYRLGRIDVPVLRGVDLSIDKGECVAVLGASGSGKSTLLHLLGGLDRPDRKIAANCKQCGYLLTGLPLPKTCPECGAAAGDEAAQNEIFFEGKSLRRFGQNELNRYRTQSIGFVFQFYHLLPELNVLQNTLLPAMVGRGRFGYLRESSKLRARGIGLLDRFGLSTRLNHRPVELSGGERQRVAIARALMNEPALLLADEPTGNLDQTTGASILDALMELHRDRKLTMAIVTHDSATAARADRVVRLVDGRVSEDANSHAPTSSPA